MSVPKAKEAMMAPVLPGNNREAMREGFFNQCEAFGTNAGAGDTSRVGFFQATVEAAWQGLLAPAGRRKKGDTTSPPSDAERASDTYAEARKKKAGSMGRRIAGKDAKDRKYRVSETNSMIRLGSQPLIKDDRQGGLGVFNRALNMIRDDETIEGRVDELLIEVARRQNDDPEKVLTDDQIKAILQPEDKPEEKKEREEVELWGNVLRQIESIMNTKFPDSAGTNNDAKTARACVVKRIDDLGGTQAMVKARAKAGGSPVTPKPTPVVRQGARGAKRKKKAA